MASKTYHMDCHGQLRIRRADAPCLPGEPASHEWSKRMRRIFFAACALAAASPSSAAADSPYEEAAKREMEHMASSVLAASVCKGVRFNGAAVIPHLAAAALLLGEKRAEDAFFFRHEGGRRRHVCQWQGNLVLGDNQGCQRPRLGHADGRIEITAHAATRFLVYVSQR